MAFAGCMDVVNFLLLHDMHCVLYIMHRAAVPRHGEELGTQSCNFFGFLT